jgi:hypothetical protein
MESPSLTPEFDTLLEETAAGVPALRPVRKIYALDLL